MKKYISLLWISILTTKILVAQYQVSGKLVDANNEPLGFANIVTYIKADSSFVGGTTSDFDGNFSLSIQMENTYFITVSMIGFENYQSEPFSLNRMNTSKKFKNITLSEGGLELEEVTITAKKPIFEQKIDRTIINLENRVATAGATALEVLEQSPGVIINRSSGSIGMLGKEGVNVMINGKLNYMPNDALLQFLNGLDANSILKIELITTPPANLDAQGNAGFINIVLKANPDEGLQGNYAITGGFGRGVLGNGSINLNFRKGKINLFGNYAYTLNDQEQFTSLDRTINSFQSSLTSEREPTRNNQNARLGMDYQIGKNTTLGVLFSGYMNKWDMDALNTIVEKEESKTKIVSQNREDNDWQHLQSNINIVHQFKNGATFSTDLDYLYYNNENPTIYNQTFKDENGAIINEQDVLSTKTTPFDISVGKVDFSTPISDNIKFSIGTKYVLSNFENDVLVEENSIPLEAFTSKSNLKENILAAYSEMDYQISNKFRLKSGLRYEFTDTDLSSSNEGKVIDRQFGAFFPSLFFNYKIDPNNQLNWSYSKRINRPAFSDMAPFIIFLSPNTSFGGNTALQPAIAHTFQIDYQFKSVNFSLKYTQEDSTIVRFQNRFDPSTNTQIIIPDNLREQSTFSTSIAFPIDISDWLNMRLFGIYINQSAISVDEKLGIQDFNQNYFRFNVSQSIKLPKDFGIELSGFYQRTSLNGNVKFEPQGVLNFGIQKKLNNNDRITFNINDLFNSLKAVGVTDLPNENIFVTRTYDFSQRTFRLTYSASFGNKKLKESRKRSSVNEEKKRVN